MPNRILYINYCRRKWQQKSIRCVYVKCFNYCISWKGLTARILEIDALSYFYNLRKHHLRNQCLWFEYLFVIFSQQFLVLISQQSINELFSKDSYEIVQTYYLGTPLLANSINNTQKINKKIMNIYLYCYQLKRYEINDFNCNRPDAGSY